MVIHQKFGLRDKLRVQGLVISCGFYTQLFHGVPVCLDIVFAKAGVYAHAPLLVLNILKQIYFGDKKDFIPDHVWSP
jgi:hypothetical protein